MASNRISVCVLSQLSCNLKLSSLSIHVRHLHMPCKTTGNKTAAFSSKVLPLPKTENNITDNVKIISLASNKNIPSPPDKPLVILLEWLMAKNKHVHKFADIYLGQGFDVMAVKLRPWQLIWPVKGSQPLAENILNILNSSYACRPLLIHGFSVGGYLWGEVQLKMSEDMPKYEQLIHNITGAIWDSPVDINETAIGVPAALFPNNSMLRNACQKYILYHMKKFEKEATQHWRRSRDLFYRPIVRCPSLLLYSASDPIGSPTSYAAVRTSYQSMGIKIFEKRWEKSPHVAHFAFHREEYLAQIEMFMEHIELLPSREKVRAVAV